MTCRARRIDVIVVYKVDRLNIRSLADFASWSNSPSTPIECVRLGHSGVFNRRPACGTIDLDGLLSFAQFEREVIGRAHPGQDRRLEEEGHLDGGRGSPRLSGREPGASVLEEHAVFIRISLALRSQIGTASCGSRLFSTTRTPGSLWQTDVTGCKTTAGGWISRGHALRSSRTRSPWSGCPTMKAHDGHRHTRSASLAIRARSETGFTATFACGARSAPGGRSAESSDANSSLPRKLFDDRGNRMSPATRPRADGDGATTCLAGRPQGRNHVKRGIRRPGAERSEIERRGRRRRRAGPRPLPIGRVGIHCISRRRAATARQPILHRRTRAYYEATLRAAIERVVMSRTTIEIELAEGMASGDQNRILIIPWTPPSPHRRREIIQGEGEGPSATRPMRTEARAVVTDALRDAHLWLDELTTAPNLNIESLAARESKTERWIRRTISLAFLSPALVKAAIEGRLPRGFGVKRLMDLPMAWPDQWAALGLRAPAER